jgi:uncharacterized protein YdiU (UPF0061 family)
LNDELAAIFGVSKDDYSDSQLAALFSGRELWPGSEPIAMAYAGHQFGHFVPQLGDGRAHLLGEVLNLRGERFDMQLKGSGATPFSRQGDGKSALGPVVREYILSEAMHALQVPTSRALAAVRTGEIVERESPMPGGVFTRLAESHVRVGTFQYFAYRRDVEGLSRLLDYLIERHFQNEFTLTPQDQIEKAFLFFRTVVERQARLIAKWMSCGFIHGVMNTDNCSVLGLTIDYGPCAFLDEYRSNQVFSSIDKKGRYAYDQQPLIAMWNLARLAECLLLLSEEQANDQIKKYAGELEKFKTIYDREWLKLMGAKLGLVAPASRGAAIETYADVVHADFAHIDRQSISQWLRYLQNESLDFTLSFRRLSELLRGQTPDKFFKMTMEAQNFFELWRKQIEARRQGISPAQIAQQMDEINPIYTPRNHLVERAIQGVLIGEDDFFHKLCRVLRAPFDENPANVMYALPPKPEERVNQTFCGT